MDLQLTGKTAFISGSTAGIGFAITKRLLEEGANVIINGRNQRGIDNAIKELKIATGKSLVSGIPADFSVAEEVTGLIEQLPPIDILVNNAGIFEPKPFSAIPDEDWYRFFEVNVMNGIRLSRHVLPRMLAENWGRIQFISSESAVYIPTEMIHYGMTKTAQLAISRGLAQLTKGTGVTVNTIMPGPTKSRGVGDFLDQWAKGAGLSPEDAERSFFTDGRPTSLLQRFASVDEIATTVVYFASPLSSATNGAAIRADGGIINSII